MNLIVISGTCGSSQVKSESPLPIGSACCTETRMRMAAQKIPWLTLLLVAAMFGLFCLTMDDSTLLRTFWYSRTEVMNGELWRLMTGHLVHFSFAHLAGNLLAFTALAIFIELQQGRKLLGFLLLFLAISSSISMLAFAPALLYYGGISSINYGLLTWMCLTHPAARGSFVIAGWRVFPSPLIIAALLGHVGFQYATARSLFSAASSADGISVAWQTHLACILTALLFALAAKRRAAKLRLVAV